jgi:hypothetical protein
METSIKKVTNGKKFRNGVGMRFSWAQPIQTRNDSERVVLVRIHRTWNGDPSQDIIMRSMWPHVSPDFDLGQQN